MASIISNQNKIISKAIVPSGVGIAANSSPSLSPSPAGSLAMDVLLPGSLFVSDGALFNPCSFAGGFMFANSATVTSVTMASTSNPSIAGCTIYVQAQTYGTNVANVGLITVVLKGPGIAVGPLTAANNYVSNKAIPAQYIPSQAVYAAVVVSLGAASPPLTVLPAFIDASGFINITNTASSNTYNFDEISFVYHL